MKKILSVLISLLMTVCLCITGAFASEDIAEKPDSACADSGDADGDKAIDAADARLVLRASVGLEKLDEKQTARGDMNSDGVIKSEDARFILRLAVELEKTPSHTEIKDEAVAAKFTSPGLSEGSHCKVCGVVFAERKAVPSILDTASAEVNLWAKNTGADAFIAVKTEGNKADIILNADGIWKEDNQPDASVFDGLLTRLGEGVKAYLGEKDTITIDGNVVFKDGRLQNTAVKTALFDIGAGFFYKMESVGTDGVFGTYDVKVNDEEIKLTLFFTGSEENLGKVKSFCKVISEHISARTSDGNLVIDVFVPDALRNVINETAGENALQKLNLLSVGAGLGIVSVFDASYVFGSEASAVNKLCETACEFSPFINKVLSKTTAFTETADGTKIRLNENAFSCAETGFGGFVAGIQGVLSDELCETPVGAFLQEDGTYSIPVHLSIDMSAAGLMAGDIITETVYVNIHLQ